MAHYSRNGSPFDTVYAATIGALSRPLLDPTKRTEVAHLAPYGSQLTPYMLCLFGRRMIGPIRHTNAVLSERTRHPYETIYDDKVA